MRKLLAVLALGSFVLGACNGVRVPQSANKAMIVVSAPLAKAGAIAQQIVHGTQLAADEINAKGGVQAGARTASLEVKVLDSELSPTVSAANVREAVRLGAVAIVDEGTGVNASWQIAAAAGIPLGIVYQGGEGLVDPRTRPNVFRIAPTARGVAFRLAEYLVPKGLKIAVLHDDSTYGADGATALAKAFARNTSSITATIRVPAGAGEVSSQILQARQSGASALLVWARPPILAAAVRSARSTGWTVPIYASTTGEDPLVRQQLSDHPEWIEGLTFAVSRLTSERGPGPFEAFRSAYERRFGADRIGVTSQGKAVVQPPDWAMYPYDFVHVVAAAMKRAGAATPGPAVLSAMNDVEVQGANGDERSFNEANHEGVVDDDIFFAAIRSMIFVPVKDDALSATLPTVRQTV